MELFFFVNRCLRTIFLFLLAYLCKKKTNDALKSKQTSLASLLEQKEDIKMKKMKKVKKEEMRFDGRKKNNLYYKLSKEIMRTNSVIKEYEYAC